MKLIIDIDEDVRVAITRMGLLRISDEMQKKVDKAIQRGTPIPDNATNDDAIKAILDERGYIAIHDRMCHTKWLFAPYQHCNKCAMNGSGDKYCNNCKKEKDNSNG